VGNSLLTYRLGDWVVDPSLCTLRCGETVRKLEPKAMDVLVVLLERAGQVVTPADILDAVWADRVVEEGAVHQRISQIRSALGDDRQHPRYIENIPRRGYRTIVPVVGLGGGQVSMAPPLGASRSESARRLSDPSTLRPWAIVALAVVTVVVAFHLGSRWPAASSGADGRRSPAQVTRFMVSLPQDVALRGLGQIAISADGRRVVAGTVTPSASRLSRRDLDGLGFLPIEGTENVGRAFALSPDGDWVAFFDTKRSRLMKVPISGGSPVTVCDPGGDLWSIAWGPGNRIVYAGDTYPGLMHVASSGGSPKPLTLPETGEFHKQPAFLADGSAVVFTIGERGATIRSADMVAAVSLESGKLKRLTIGASPRVSARQHLIYYRDHALWAARFDTQRLELVGESVAVGQGVRYLGSASYDVAVDGTLVHLPDFDFSDRALIWVDPSGIEHPLPMEPRPYLWPRVSPSGDRVAVVINARGGADLWVLELERGTATRLTFDESREASPVWTSDGSHIIYSSNRVDDLFRVAADGSRAPEQLTYSEYYQFAAAVTRDDRYIVFAQYGSDSLRHDIGVMSNEHEPGIEMVLRSEFTETFPSLSPDDQWLAYSDDRTGRMESYVRAFPVVESRAWPISSGGGVHPIWMNDREITYAGPGHMMSVAIRNDPENRISAPKPLFAHEGYVVGYDRHHDFDRTRGKFLMIKTAPDGEVPADVAVVSLNWLDEVSAKLPMH
jgi:DNA-binding winged helix-turn-helix (wHTH) protein